MWRPGGGTVFVDWRMNPARSQNPGARESREDDYGASLSQFFQSVGELSDRNGGETIESGGLLLDDFEAERLGSVEQGRRVLMAVITMPDRNADRVVDLYLNPRWINAFLQFVVAWPDVLDHTDAKSVLLRVVPQLNTHVSCSLHTISGRLGAPLYSGEKPNPRLAKSYPRLRSPFQHFRTYARVRDMRTRPVTPSQCSRAGAETPS